MTLAALASHFSSCHASRTTIIEGFQERLLAVIIGDLYLVKPGLGKLVSYLVDFFHFAVSACST